MIPCAYTNSRRQSFKSVSPASSGNFNSTTRPWHFETTVPYALEHIITIIISDPILVIVQFPWDTQPYLGDSAAGLVQRFLSVFVSSPSVVSSVCFHRLGLGFGKLKLRGRRTRGLRGKIVRIIRDIYH